VLLDADSRLIVTLVIGRRDTDTARQAFADFYRRTDGDLTPLITSDEYAPYFTVIMETYGVRKEELELTEEQQAEFGWDEMPEVLFPQEISYATVHKEREADRVVAVERRLIFGTERRLREALKASAASRTINTSFVERQHGTDRGQNARKARKTYRFSKDWRVHEAMTYYTLYRYNFCWVVRTLRRRDEQGRWQRRTPAMAAGLADHVWSTREWVGFPAVQVA
jgi:hypothetical protein